MKPKTFIMNNIFDLTQETQIIGVFKHEDVSPYWADSPYYEKEVFSRILKRFETFPNITPQALFLALIKDEYAPVAIEGQTPQYNAEYQLTNLGVLMPTGISFSNAQEAKSFVLYAIENRRELNIHYERVGKYGSVNQTVHHVQPLAYDETSGLLHCKVEVPDRQMRILTHKTFKISQIVSLDFRWLSAYSRNDYYNFSIVYKPLPEGRLEVSIYTNVALGKCNLSFSMSPHEIQSILPVIHLTT